MYNIERYIFSGFSQIQTESNKKRAEKMIAVKNILYQFVFKLITKLLSFIFIFSTSCTVRGVPPETTPEDFIPVVRFAACSDIHLSGDESCPYAPRMADMFEDAYDYAESDSNYKNLDAVLVVGDFADSGKEAQYKQYNKIVSEHIREGTQLMTVLGNHEFIEYRDYDATIGYDVFKKYISENVDIHTVINGYHFIGVSYDDNGKTFVGKTLWLKQQLDEAVADTGDKPIFVFQHPHPLLSVYGSLIWGCAEIRAVLERYPQVVDFSGHSHYTSSDPRSVWQGSFTAVGTGTLSDYMGNVNYIHGADTPYPSGGFWIVEADAQGNVRLQLYDVINHRFFDDSEYYLTELSDKSKRTLTWNNRVSLDTAPQFPENAEITVNKEEDGTYTLFFPDAAGYYKAEDYKTTVYSDIFHTAWSGSVISGYALAQSDGTKVNIGALDGGKYYVRITAYSPYAKRGETLKSEFTAE